MCVLCVSVADPALARLEHYETLMLFFERLGCMAGAARFAYAARTSGSVLLLLIVIGASPLWGGYLVSRLGSGYVIPSRSMESTLSVGDVVLAGEAGQR